MMELLGYVLFLILIIAVILKQWKQSNKSAIVMEPKKMQIEVEISDKGKDNLPVVTIKASGGTINIESIKQDTGNYIVTAEKKDDNEVSIAFEKRVAPSNNNLIA